MYEDARSRELPVKSQCLPFRQIPHTTPLYTDFLSWSPSIQPFYSRSPQFAEWWKDETAAVRYDPVRRQRVADVLERQNKAWSASPKTLENIARLRGGASAIVTGQQVGLFGGPLFSLFKALTTVKLAHEATNGGSDCVPVFWLATADHDLAEINHVSVLGTDGSLHKLTSPTQGAHDAPVGAVTFGAEIEEVVETAAGWLGDSEATRFLRESYRPGETFGSAYARLFSRLFADWGVILLDGSDPEVQQIAQPVYVAAIERAAELDDALLARGKELETAGYHQQVKVTPSSTLLFMLRNGARTPIHRRSNGMSAETDFLIGDKTILQAELLRRFSSDPHLFSANVLLRPVVQDYLLPTLAYVGGAAEIAYFGQGAVVYQALLGRITPILPRFSATVVETNLWLRFSCRSNVWTRLWWRPPPTPDPRCSTSWSNCVRGRHAPNCGRAKSWFATPNCSATRSIPVRFCRSARLAASISPRDMGLSFYKISITQSVPTAWITRSFRYHSRPLSAQAKNPFIRNRVVRLYETASAASEARLP